MSVYVCSCRLLLFLPSRYFHRQQRQIVRVEGQYYDMFPVCRTLALALAWPQNVFASLSLGLAAVVYIGIEEQE